MRPTVRSLRNLVVCGVLGAAVLSAAVVLTPQGSGASASTAVAAHASAGADVPADQSATPARTARTARTWGVTNPDLPWNTSAMSDLAAGAGATPDVVMWYVAWSLRSGFPVDDADRVRSWGSTPEITWEPWDPSAGVDQPAYSLARITQGDFDSYIADWAHAVAAWGHPLRLRFAHEMNGNWYPWDQGVNGNANGSYVKAWRHVHHIFTAAGATNVTWIWSPNVPYPGSTPLHRLFPGDATVDEVALDGYNWGTMQGGRWTSFAGVFGPGVRQLSALSQLPISIGEVGCPQTGGAKDAWMRSMWRTLAGWPQVRGLMWFDYDKEADWRINSSATSLAAFRHGVSHYLAG